MRLHQINCSASTGSSLRIQRVNDFVLPPRRFLSPSENRFDADNLHLNNSAISFFERNNYGRRLSVDGSSHLFIKEFDSQTYSKFGFDCGFSFGNDTFENNHNLFLNRKLKRHVYQNEEGAQNNCVYFSQSNLDKINRNPFTSVPNTANPKRLLMSIISRKIRFVEKIDMNTLNLPVVVFEQENAKRIRRKSQKLKEVEEVEEELEQAINYGEKRKRLSESKEMKYKYKCEFCEMTFLNPQAKGGHISKAHSNLPSKYKRKVKSRIIKEQNRLKMLVLEPPGARDTLEAVSFCQVKLKRKYK